MSHQIVERRLCAQGTRTGRRGRWIGMVLLAALAGCSKDNSDLDSYFAEVKARKSTDIEIVPQMRPYERFTYVGSGRRSPFDNAETEIARLKPNNGLAPDLQRTREPLEEFPLDALNLLGVLGYGEKRWALVRSADGIVHRVAVGQHLGRNSGRVTAISERRVDIKEIVPDGLGGWMQRDAWIAQSE